ncbi:MAG: hypothetical protein KBA66_06460 [Leptospiraceae bacterium]|nr:hypothetical protein [Leptospiraceae bacterium]
MNAIELKSDILKLINIIEDESFLHAIRILLLKQIPNSETKDFWNDLPIRIRKDIETALMEADKGELIPHEEVMKEFRVKYLKA